MCWPACGATQGDEVLAIGRTGRGVTVKAFVNSPYDRYVTTRSRFWEAGGLDAHWTLRLAAVLARPGDVPTGLTQTSGRIQLHEPVAGESLEAAVAAHDRALARLAAAIAEAIHRSSPGAR